MTTTEEKVEVESAPSWAWSSFGVLLVLLTLVLLIMSTCSGDDDDPVSPSTPTSGSGYVPHTRTMPTVDLSWSHQTFDIPAQGLPVYLYPGWKDFAFGGAITITTPSGHVLHDEPGVNHQWGFQPAGMYIFRADPMGSRRSVQIYNQWRR